MKKIKLMKLDERATMPKFAKQIRRVYVLLVRCCNVIIFALSLHSGVINLWIHWVDLCY